VKKGYKNGSKAMPRMAEVRNTAASAGYNRRRLRFRGGGDFMNAEVCHLKSIEGKEEVLTGGK